MVPKPQGLRCYATLGVSPYADLKTLRSAYKRLALQEHPDKNSNAVEAKEKFQHLKETLDYLKDDACRKQYDQIIATAYSQITRQLHESYKKLHKVRQKICQSQTHPMDPETNAGGHNEKATSDMNTESQLLELIKRKSQELAALNGEIRQVPVMSDSPEAAQWWRTVAQSQVVEVESLEQQVASQKTVLDLQKAEIDRLREENKTQSQKVAELDQENAYQKELVRERNAEVAALKMQIQMRDMEISRWREFSTKVQDEKDQLRVLNKLLLEKIKALKEERDRQQAAFNKVKENETRLEAERDTLRTIQKVYEEQQHEGRELKNDIRELKDLKLGLEELKRELKQETDKVSEKVTTTRNMRNGACVTRSNTKRSESGKRLRSPDEVEKSTTSEGGNMIDSTKRPCPRTRSESDDIFIPSLNMSSSASLSGGLVSENDGSVANQSVALVRQETSSEPR